MIFINYKTHIYLVVCLACFYKNTRAQTFYEYHGIYQEKTPEIMVLYDTAFYFKTVNLFSLVDYRLFTNKQVIDDILSENSFNNSKANDTSNYLRYPINASLLKNYCEFETAKILNHYMGTGVRKPSLSNSDSLLLINELSLLKKQVKDSLIKEIRMSANLISVLKKYPADIDVVTDILMYHSKHSFPKTMNNCAILRVFVFDLRQTKIVVYNYKTVFDGGNYKIDDFHGLKKRFKKIIHSLKPYMKANKRYFGIDRKKWAK